VNLNLVNTKLAALRVIDVTPGRDRCLERVLIIWFQDDYAMPIAAEVQARMVSLDWPSLATQVEW
jgi:hypothetical protein